MKRLTALSLMLTATTLVLCSACHRERVSLWERMCESCHDGSTVLNGKVVIDRKEMTAKFKTQDDLVRAVTCGAPPCMNILKHDEGLVRKVGAELGIKGSSKP